MRSSLRFLSSVFFLISVAVAQVNLQSFEGIDAATEPEAQLDVDPNGAVGTKQYLQWVNTFYQAYDKTTLAPIFPSAVQGDTPWRLAGMSNCYGTNGDGVILFDHLASRWVIGRRQGTSSYYYCIAVSNTDDLTSSTFNVYQLSLNARLGQNANLHTYFPDYPKIGTWSDGYYVSIDLLDPDLHYKPVGVLVCAFDRVNMLAGVKARTPQCFRTPNPPTTAAFRGHSLLPADIEGGNAPSAGTPEYLVSIANPSGQQTSSSKLNLWKFQVNWSKPANTTFTGPTAITVSPYTPGCYTLAQPFKTTCVPEPSTATTLKAIDSVGDRLMHRFAYRRFTGTTAYESYLITHTVQAGSGGNQQTGIRWYEMRPTGQIVNSGTISPGDGNYRFMPSVAQDKVGNLAVGYSVSGTTLHPSINASYLNLPTQSSPTEFQLVAGDGDEENSYHWGDYTSMTVDPVDDCTFWYVNEYYTSNQIGTTINWQTRLSSFKIANCN